MTAEIIALAERRAEPVLVVTTAPAAPAEPVLVVTTAPAAPADAETPPNAGEAVALLAGACRALITNLATMQRRSLGVVEGMAAMKDVALSIAEGGSAVREASHALTTVPAVTCHA